MPAIIYCRVCKTTTALSSVSDRRAYELEVLAEEHAHADVESGAAPPASGAQAGGPRKPGARLYDALFGGQVRLRHEPPP